MRKKRIIGFLCGAMCCSLIGGIGFNLLPLTAETLPNNPTTTVYEENYTDQDNVTGVRATTKVVNGKANFEYWNLMTTEELAESGFVFKMSPEDYNVAETTGMKIILEDALDETKQIIIALAVGDNWWGNKRTYGFTSLADDVAFSGGFCQIAGTKQYCLGNYYEARATNNTQGAGPINGWAEGYDQGKNVFTTPKETHFQYADGVVSHGMPYNDDSYVISDLKDDTYQENSVSSLRYDEAYSDLVARYTDEYVDNLFSSGYVRLKFEFVKTVSDTVSFMITKIGGEAITEVKDTTAPLFDVTYSTNALVGVEYALPNLTVTDIFTQNVTCTKTLKAPDGTETTLKGNTFTPDQAGKYTIVYSATDTAGNEGKKSYEIQAYETVPEVSFVKGSDAELTDSYYVYETLKLPVFEARSGLSLNANNALATSVQLKLNGAVLFEEKCVEELDYTLQQSGTYEIVYVSEDAFGNKTSYTYATITVMDYPYIAELSLVYVNIGSLYTPSVVEALYKGDSYETECRIFDANGVEIALTDGGFIPTEEAEYKAVYSVTVDGMKVEREQTLSAVYSPREKFVYGNNVEMTNGFVLPNYSNEIGTGVYIKSKGSTTITWGQVIDLSQLSETDSLIKFLPYSEDDCGAANYTIKLTDIYNAKNTVEIKLIKHESMSYSYINISYDGRRLARYSDGAIHDWPQFGYTSWFGHGRFKTGTLFSLKCNYAKKQFFINEEHWLLMDLDDGSQVGYGREWEGFTTGEVYMEISIETSADYAGIILTEAAGTTLSGYSIDDKTAPYLYLNEPKCYVNNAGTLPSALVNRAYPLVTATAYDAIFGACEVNYTVYYNGDTTNLYTSSMGDSFTPNKAGTYTYIISALDPKGNKAIWTGEFTAYETLASMAIALGEYDVNTLQAGGYFRIPEILATGGSGVIAYEYTIYLNGEEVSAEDCGDLYLGEVGELVFSFTAVDYIGTTLEKEITLQVVASSSPVLFVSSIPNAAIYGQTLTFPDFEAIDYNYSAGESGYNAYRCIRVNGSVIYAAKGGSASGSLSYLVNDASKLVVEYCAGSNASNLTSISEYIIPVVTVSKNADYIVPVNFSEDCAATKVTVDATSNGIAFITDGDKAFTLLNPVACNSLALRFSGVQGKAGQKYMDIVLTDYADARNSVLLRIQKIDGSYYLNINGISAKNIQLTGSMEKVDSYINIGYSQADKGIITEDGNVVAIERNLLGNAFNGFESGLVRVSFELHGVKGEGSVNIYQVGNQVFIQGDSVKDNSGPQIWYETAMLGATMKKGSTLLISKANAQDVLCGASVVYVTVRTPNGILPSMNNVLADQTRALTLDTFGYYTITYTATDANGIKTTTRIVYYCKDEIAPTLYVSGKIPTTATVGESLSFPSATYEDNYSECTLSVMVLAPDGSTTKLAEGYEFTPTMKGKHYVVYFLTDADYNMAIARYEMEVK